MRGIGAVLMCLALLTLGTVQAHADTAPIRPGDTIVQGGKKCTLGYVFRRAGYTMGLTAGHCAATGTITDTDAGVAGTLVGAKFVDENEDWQLIDFGDSPWSQRIRNTPYWMTATSTPTPGQSMCHYGNGSGAVNCGKTLDVYGSSIAVVATGKPGDSGGPCFVPVSADEATAVGLWHGHDTKVPELGYCVTVNAALRAFGEHVSTDA
ncbi:endopeptidase [Mycobacteroides abscessus subsp. abscessus]|uniref:hypothetical protein n=1 Tax=Mycobacteroides abscessus TaxID=36809 RepID=UPI0009C4A154|nr:hypothetical protein [Mycobacteroides abscessus]SKO34426.1 endopeptidase [Mycobacteroides abscessus subsp. abscessus]